MKKLIQILGFIFTILNCKGQNDTIYLSNFYAVYGKIIKVSPEYLYLKNANSLEAIKLDDVIKFIRAGKIVVPEAEAKWIGEKKSINEKMVFETKEYNKKSAFIIVEPNIYVDGSTKNIILKDEKKIGPSSFVTICKDLNKPYLEESLITYDEMDRNREVLAKLGLVSLAISTGIFVYAVNYSIENFSPFGGGSSAKEDGNYIAAGISTMLPILFFSGSITFNSLKRKYARTVIREKYNDMVLNSVNK